jgi:hypothetical protein
MAKKKIEKSIVAKRDVKQTCYNCKFCRDSARDLKKVKHMNDIACSNPSGDIFQEINPYAECCSEWRKIK